jgi:hypothetical protein
MMRRLLGFWKTREEEDTLYSPSRILCEIFGSLCSELLEIRVLVSYSFIDML